MSENNPQQPEKKIVLRSAGDPGVNAADQTHKAGAIKLTISDPMKMRETESSNLRRMTPPGQIADPMEMRHTDTGGLRRLTAQEASGEDVAQKARRTIKLKPVAAEPEEDEDKEQTVALQRSELDVESPEEGGSQEADAAVEDVQTVKMVRPSAMKQPPMPGSASDSLPPPSSSVPGAKQTIKLRPASGDSASGSAPTVVKPSSAATLKLKPVSATSSSAPPPASGAAPTVGGGGTMKLRPASSPPPSAPEGAEEADGDTLAVAKKPFKLVNTSRAGSLEGTAAPSDPTLKLEPPTTLAGAVPPDTPTLRLSNKSASPESSPSKPTLRLKSSTVPSASSEESGGGGGGSGLSVAAATAVELPPSLQGPPSAAAARKAKKPAKPLSAEPSALFVLASALTVVFLVVYLGIVVAQFGSMKLGMDLPVPGLSGAYAPTPETP